MPGASVATFALRLQFGELPFQRGGDSCLAIVLARSAQFPGMFLRATLDRLDDGPAFAGALHREGELPHRLVEEEGRRHQSELACGPYASEFAVELPGIRLQSRQVRLGVRRALDAVVAVEEPRDVEIRTDVLDHDVGRVAPVAHRDVAVRQCEARERRGIRTPHDVQAGARRMRQAAGIEGVDAGQVGANLRRDPLLAGLGSIGELRPERRARAGIDAERRGALRKQGEQVLRALVEQGERGGFAILGRALAATGAAGLLLTRAGVEPGQGCSGREGGDDVAAAEGVIGHGVTGDSGSEV